MTEEIKKERKIMTEESHKPQIYSHQEIHELFDTSFLPKILEFARRTKKEMFADEEVACFQVRLIMEFSDLEAPLTYESIKEKVNLQLQPVLQEDVDKAKAESEAAAKEGDGKATTDA